MCLQESYKKKYEIFFASLKSLKKRVGSASVVSGTRIKMSETENFIKWDEIRKFECKRKTLFQKSKQIICSCGLFYYC